MRAAFLLVMLFVAGCDIGFWCGWEEVQAGSWRCVPNSADPGVFWVKASGNVDFYKCDCTRSREPVPSFGLPVRSNPDECYAIAVGSVDPRPISEGGYGDCLTSMSETHGYNSCRRIVSSGGSVACGRAP